MAVLCLEYIAKRVRSMRIYTSDPRARVGCGVRIRKRRSTMSSEQPMYQYNAGTGSVIYHPALPISVNDEGDQVFKKMMQVFCRQNRRK